VKKGIVAVLVLLAVVILISPGIVGRLAERSMDDNLNWAAEESGELTVTTQRFDRGWFSSQGQHRVQLREGELLTAIRALAGPLHSDDVPVLLINTHLDHGLIPLSSIAREKGSLSPGLGSAVSTMTLEFGDGKTIELPGKIFSKVGLNGQLQSSYVLAADSYDADGTSATWDDTSIDVTTDVASGDVTFSGTIGAFSIADDGEGLSVGSITFAGRQKPTPHGVAVGDITLDLADLKILGAGGGSVPSLSARASASLDDGRMNGDTRLDMAMRDIPDVGEMSVAAAVHVRGADATSLGRLQRSLESAGTAGDPMHMMGTIEPDLKMLFAHGFELEFEQLDITLPQGTVAAKLRFACPEGDPSAFEWTSLLLGAEAAIDLAIPVPIMDMIMAASPDAGAAVGMGYLRRNGDVYEMKAEYKKGLATINGAPIPIPAGSPQT